MGLQRASAPHHPFIWHDMDGLYGRSPRSRMVTGAQGPARTASPVTVHGGNESNLNGERRVTKWRLVIAAT